MRQWVFLLHFYQPPSQSLDMTEGILRSCYLPILDALIANPQVKLTINLSASLIIQLESLQSHDFFPKLHLLLKREQIELLNSPIFHPIIPLTPDNVVFRQIQENAEVIKKFCQVRPISGLFPPELALDQHTLEIMTGKFDFLIADESSLNPNFDNNKIPLNSIFLLSGEGNFSQREGKADGTWVPAKAAEREKKLPSRPLRLLIISRSLSELLRAYPGELQADKLINYINTGGHGGDSLNANASDPDRRRGTADEHLRSGVARTRDNILISLSDAEIFGHHYQERIHFLRDLFSNSEIKFIKATTALKSTSPQPLALSRFTPSSWQTSGADLKVGIPLPIWKHPGNRLQQDYYRLADMAYRALESTPSDSPYRHTAENNFDRGLSSCHTYWLSNFPWWHPDMVEQGARYLVKSVRDLPIAPETKKTIEEFYHQFILDVWEYHWSSQVAAAYKKFDVHREAFLKTLPKI